MQSGESVSCPRCGEKTIVKSRRRYDGFTAVGEEYYCMICLGALGAAAPPAAPGAADRSADRLAALLDTVIAAPPTLDAGPAERRFCRDCMHFIAHPFLSRCEYHHREVNPMNDCPDFERKKS